MNVKNVLQNEKIHKVICWVLIAAIAAGLLIPGTSVQITGPEAPLPDESAQILADLNLGEETQKAEEIEEVDASVEQGGQSKNEKEQNENFDEPQEKQEQQQEESGGLQENPQENRDESGTTENMDNSAGSPGVNDGLQGAQSGEVVELGLGAVLTWEKYGKYPKHIICASSETVRSNINTAQLDNDMFAYSFALTGQDAEKGTIKRVLMKAGDQPFEEIEKRGDIRISLPNRTEGRTYTFQVEVLWKGKDANGKSVEELVDFTYELHFAHALDLELELIWTDKDNAERILACPANETVVKTIKSHQLSKGQFAYVPKLTGALAKDVELVEATYSTASGKSGSLDLNGGTLTLKGVGENNQDIYYLTFVVEAADEDGVQQTVYYHITIEYVDTVDVQVSFTWLERGAIRRVMHCQQNATVSTDIKNNQLSAGALKYEIELFGEDSGASRILSIHYEAESGHEGALSKSGAIPFILPMGEESNTYNVVVMVLHEGKKLKYEISLRYVMDVQLEMTYQVRVNGTTLDKSILCENGKTKTAEAIYDDQLTRGMLSYHMETKGGENVEITSVKCYQSGNGRMTSLEERDQIELLLNGRKTGENTFTVTAQDDAGATYTFKINVKYKARGQNNIKFATNMTDGQTVINETDTNFNVKAWSEDESGNIVSYIPANGEDTKLIVELDGERLRYVSTSGRSSEYILYPKNPPRGDQNEHTVYIYAEDEYGNYGELILNLKGQRKQDGQKKGTATIRIDMTVLGLGVVETVSYEVLSGEPISYAVAKAVMGEDTGEPFGAAKESLGWGGRYKGTLDIGFYLQSLTPGLRADGLKENSWNKYGSSEEEVLNAIDRELGKGTGLATLWRCIYRNGLNKSKGTNDSYGEFDYTSGSGWLFALDGTYYPGLSMSEYSLEDGDVLTLRYTLAHGWDVGGGTPGYGNTLGYCVTVLDGQFYINHQMEHVTNEDGTKSYVCHCCGLVEACLHENVVRTNQGDGTHIAHCEDCNTDIGDAELHNWDVEDEKHVCSACDAEENHNWKEVEGSNTATCTEQGERTVYCTICNTQKTERSLAKGHTLNNRWNHTQDEHYRKCSVCKEIVESTVGKHQYVYNEHDDDWYCSVCDAGHDWDYCGNSGLIIQSATCKKIIYFCEDCGFTLEKEGTFDEHHDYVDGTCVHCGKADVIVPPEEPEDPDNP